MVQSLKEELVFQLQGIFSELKLKTCFYNGCNSRDKSSPFIAFKSHLRVINVQTCKSDTV